MWQEAINSSGGGNGKYYSGSYANNASVQEINCGFRPKYIFVWIVYNNPQNTNAGGYSYYNADYSTSQGQEQMVRVIYDNSGNISKGFINLPQSTTGGIRSVSNTGFNVKADGGTTVYYCAATDIN